jgi:hypothetical protein
MNNQPETLEEVYKLLGELKDAWDAIGANRDASINAASGKDGGQLPKAPPSVPAMPPIDPLAPRQTRHVKA